MVLKPACLLVLGLALPLAGQAAAPRRASRPQSALPPPMVVTPSGLRFLDEKVGTGAAPARGQRIVVHYTGWLSDHGKKGRKFDSSRDRREPLIIPVGVGKLIKGWDEGLMTMRVGGRRTLYIPASLGYGAKGAGEDIPPGADLIFEVELLGIR